MGRPLFLRLIIAVLALGAFTVAGASARPFAKVRLIVLSGLDGAVASRDGGIDCGSRCASRYARGTVVSLTATPDRFFAFERWRGGCVGTAPSCFVVLDRARTVSGSFVRKTARLALTVSGPGTIVSSPAGIVCGRDDSRCFLRAPAGTQITLTPDPALGGIFGAWSDVCRSAGQGVCTLVLDDKIEVLAAFAHTDPDPDQPQLTVVPEGVVVTSEPSGIACPPTCQAEYPSGTHVTIRGNISQWSGLCVGVVQACLIVLDNSDGTGTGGPFFGGPGQFGISITVSGPGMVTTNGIRCGRTTLYDCEGIYQRGATIVLKATPGKRSRFMFWRGFCTGKKKICTLRVTAPKTVQALFRR